MSQQQKAISGSSSNTNANIKKTNSKENRHVFLTEKEQLEQYGRIVEHEEISCGILLFRKLTSKYDFLLMKHSRRLDLPKGRMEPGETFIETAKREFNEETSIPLDLIGIHPDFLFEEKYAYFSKSKSIQVGKTLKMYIAFAKDSSKLNIKLTEHGDCKWTQFKEKESMTIQNNTIDPLLKSIQDYMNEKGLDLEALEKTSLSSNI